MHWCVCVCVYSNFKFQLIKCFSIYLQCSDSSKISFANVTECKNGEKGVELQLDAEKETHLIAKPYPSFIPTIVYNKVIARNNF